MRLTFYRDAQERLLGFRAEQHTGYAPAGQDIVCAAVSALTQATLNGLVSVQKLPVDSQKDEKKALLEARLGKDAGDAEIREAQVRLRTLQEAMEAIERQYPRFVSILYKDRR